MKILKHIALITFFSLLLILNGVNSYALNDPQKKRLYFKSYTLDQGLSHNTVFSIEQDYQGFIWFGTQGGLNRFDGYEFKKYFHDPEDSLTLPGNTVNCVFQDSKNWLWVVKNEDEVLHLEYDSINGPIKAELVDSTSRLEKEILLNGEITINVGNFEPGVCFIRLVKNSEVVIKKVIKVGAF